MKKLNLTICTNGTYEEEKALIDKSTKEILCRGDYYHDKIDDFIEGFIYGLNYYGFEVTTNDETINPDNELFEKLEFTNEDCYDENDDDSECED